MKTDHTVTVHETFAHPASEVWKGLTDPELIRQYFFGTEARSEWKKGASLEWSGEWEGKKYLDKGVIVEIEPERLLHYTYLSSMSGKEDRPENYADVYYKLEEVLGKTNLTIIQEGSETEEAKAHSEGNWRYMMQAMRELLDKNS